MAHQVHAPKLGGGGLDATEGLQVQVGLEKRRNKIRESELRGREEEERGDIVDSRREKRGDRAANEMA